MIYSQGQIDRLDDYEYSLFLAYGDSFNQTIRARGRSNSVWESSTARLHETFGGKVLRFGQRVRCSFNKGSLTIFD